jgi:hypothetical protein
MEPPLGTNAWQLYCDAAWTDVNFTITAVYTNGVPVIVTGSCVDGIDDFYEPVGTTNDGRPYFQGASNGVVLYHDEECHHEGSWVFSADVDVSTAVGDGLCSSLVYIFDDSLEPPLGTNEWSVSCNEESWTCEATCYSGGFAYEQLTVTQTTFFPTAAPTFSERPSVSPAPTDQVTQVTGYMQVRLLIGAVEEGEELRLEVASDLTFADGIIIDEDSSVTLAGDAAASRPTLSGGDENRFFSVEPGATLELKYLELADGNGDNMHNGDDETTQAGAIIVLRATLIIIDCIIRSCYAEVVRRLRLECLARRRTSWGPGGGSSHARMGGARSVDGTPITIFPNSSCALALRKNASRARRSP